MGMRGKPVPPRDDSIDFRFTETDRPAGPGRSPNVSLPVIRTIAMLTFWGIYLLSGIHNPREKADLKQAARPKIALSATRESKIVTA